MTRRRLHALLLVGALLLTACQTDPGTRSTQLDDAEVDPGSASERTAVRSLEQRGAPSPTLAELRGFEHVLPWGEGPGAVGWRAPAEEFVGDGPSGVAVRPDGSVIVADRLHGRLIEVDASGARELQAIPEDATTLARSPRGKLALYSSLRSLVWVHDEAGVLLGELALPRILGDVVRIEFDEAERVVVETSLQTRFHLGTADAPLDEAAVLRTIEAGVASRHGRSITAIREADGRAYLVESASRNDRLEELRRIPVSAEASSVRLLGLDGDRAVTVVERVSEGAPGPDGTPVVVSRELVVVSLSTGRRLGAAPLPGRGLWSPRHALAMGGGHVAWLRPEADGLRVASLPIDSIARGGVQ